MILDVIQPLHCSGSDVQQGVLVLEENSNNSEDGTGNKMSTVEK